jgi:hypothetical protein
MFKNATQITVARTVSTKGEAHKIHSPAKKTPPRPTVREIKSMQARALKNLKDQLILLVMAKNSIAAHSMNTYTVTALLFDNA